jgi:hypothetical protein
VTRPVIPAFTLLNAPLHGPSWRATVGQDAFNTGADFIFWSEGYRAWPWLNDHRAHYESFTAQGCKVDARGRNVGHDVITSVRKDWHVKAHGQFWIDREIRPIKYRPQRHGVWVLAEDETGLSVLLVPWHPQPGPLRRVEAKIRDLEHEHRPDVVLSGGDLQVGMLGRWIGPNRMYKRLGMHATHRGVIWTAVKGARSVVRRAIAAARRFRGMDHPWDLETFEVTR